MTLEYIRLSCKQLRKQLIWDTILIPPIMSPCFGSKHEPFENFKENMFIGWRSLK